VEYTIITLKIKMLIRSRFEAVFGKSLFFDSFKINYPIPELVEGPVLRQAQHPS
jgi:hypothetical protein